MNIRVATENDKQAIFALRFEVFVDEQKVPPTLELDEEDAHATHIIAEENGVTVGCARVVFSPQDAHIGRLAVKQCCRGRGIGAEVCRFAMEQCLARMYTYIWLNAQCQAIGFYEKLGFRPEGKTFEEAGIPHVKMVYAPTKTRGEA